MSLRCGRLADGAEVVRAGARRDDDQFGDRNHALDRHGDRRRRVDDGEFEALLAQDFKVGSQPRDRGLGKGRKVGFAFVPPVGERTLRVDIDEDDRARAGKLRLHREMTRQGGFTRPALL